MGTLYIDTGGATTNSGSSDNNAADLSGAAATADTTTITLDGSPDLSGVSTSGATQATIALAQATNSNQKIFWITAVDNALKTVTVSVAPTGITSSAWTIGGRMVHTPANYQGGMRAGDEAIYNNSPAFRTSSFITSLVAGTGAAGYVKHRGKTGTRPVFNVTNTASVLTGSGGQALQWWENFELDQDGASGAAINGLGPGGIIYNVKISDAGGVGYSMSDTGTSFIAGEITGTGSNGISGSLLCAIVGNYLHDLTGDGLLLSGNGQSCIVTKNILDSCSDRAINLSGAPTTYSHLAFFDGNTSYGCGNSGFEVADQDCHAILINSIFSENGNAAGEYNVEWVAGAAEYASFHGWNVFYHSGGGGGANLSGLTVNAQVASSEFTTDPAFTDAAGGDFAISSTSPAKAAGFPGQFL